MFKNKPQNILLETLKKKVTEIIKTRREYSRWFPKNDTLSFEKVIGFPDVLNIDYYVNCLERKKAPGTYKVPFDCTLNITNLSKDILDILENHGPFIQKYNINLYGLYYRICQTLKYTINNGKELYEDRTIIYRRDTDYNEINDNDENFERIRDLFANNDTFGARFKYQEDIEKKRDSDLQIYYQTGIKPNIGNNPLVAGSKGGKKTRYRKNRYRVRQRRTKRNK